MVIQCEHCQAKFKLDDSKVGPKGVKVRCTKCKEVFVVKPPATPAAPAAPAAAAPAPAVPAQAATPAPAAPAAPAQQEEQQQEEEEEQQQEEEDAGSGFDFGSPTDAGTDAGTTAPPAADQAQVSPPQQQEEQQEEEEEDAGSGFDFGSPTDAGTDEGTTAPPQAAAPAPEAPPHDYGGAEFELDTGREEEGGMDSFEKGDGDSPFGGFDFGGNPETGESDHEGVEPSADTGPAVPGLESSFDLGEASQEGLAPEQPQEEGGGLDFGKSDDSSSTEGTADSDEGGLSFDFSGAASDDSLDEETDAGGETIVFSINDTQSGVNAPAELAPTPEAQKVLDGFDKPKEDGEDPVFEADEEQSTPVATPSKPAVPEGATSSGISEDLGEDFGMAMDSSTEDDNLDDDFAIDAMTDEGEADAKAKKEKATNKRGNLGPAIKKGLAAILIIGVLGGGGFYAYTSGILNTLISDISGGMGGETVKGDAIAITDLNVTFRNNVNLGYIMAVRCKVKNLTDSNQDISSIKATIKTKGGKVFATKMVGTARILSDSNLDSFTDIEIKKHFRDSSSNPLPPKGETPVMVVFTKLTPNITSAEIEIIQ